MKTTLSLYQFRSSNLIKNSTLNLKESQNLSKILKIYFEKLGILSSPQIQITNSQIKIQFYYYSPQSSSIPNPSYLEEFLSQKYHKEVWIQAIPLKYPYLNSEILSQYLSTTEITDFLSTLDSCYKPCTKKTQKTQGIPQYLSGITLRITGRSQKNNTRTVRQSFFLGTSSPFQDSGSFEYKNKNGLNTISVTLYSTP
uniref:Small ribosomal subunit protein uS3m n=1 Tax=Pneumocystis oryctolagi TaxID=42067 RepID=A0A8A6W5E0_9ASCO|nr:hypothetical protein MFU99_mgp06 [Pneumocystis oryctolagi]QTK22313.1 hypothetical protein [Pneumocystis oryctolagi]